MTPPGRNAGKTPERLVNLVKDAVEKSSQSAVSRESGVALLTIQRCLKGIGEPSTATLEKLAVYFEKSVAWLRGEDDYYQLSGDDIRQIANKALLSIATGQDVEQTKKMLKNFIQNDDDCDLVYNRIIEAMQAAATDLSLPEMLETALDQLLAEPIEALKDFTPSALPIVTKILYRLAADINFQRTVVKLLETSEAE